MFIMRSAAYTETQKGMGPQPSTSPVQEKHTGLIGTSIGASADWMEASGMLMLLDVFSEAWRSYVVWHVETVA